MSVLALVNDPDQVGWRGNTIQWAKRARKLLNDEQQPLLFADMQKIAACIRDVRLLRPDLAIHCPPHVPNAWDALYADTCHVVVTNKAPSMSTLNWLGALAYYVRHHPQMGVRRAHQIVSPGWDAVSMARTDAAWGVGRACRNTDCLRTRTVLVLLSATVRGGSATDDGVGTCVAWLCDRPIAHFCDRLLDLFRDATPILDALSHKRHRPWSASEPIVHPDNRATNPEYDVLGHQSLQFFHDV